MISKKRIALLAGIMVLCVAALAARAEKFITVSPSGDDRGPGTVEKPFATIARAQKAVRELTKTGLTEDVVVVLRGGTYRLTEPLVFGPADGGDGRSRVTYKAYPKERVVISGGVEITGWRDRGDGVWAAKVPAALTKAGFNELFAADRRCTPARHPNKGYLRVDKAVHPRRSFLFIKGDIPPVRDANQVTLAYLHDWAMTRVAVASIDQAARKLTTKYDVGCKANYWRICGYEAHPRYFVEGAREFLDAPGEWWLDRARSEVLYKPIPGEKLEGFVAVAPLAKQLLVVRGESPKKCVRKLQFRDLTFEHCAWRHEGYRYAGSQAGFHFTGKTHEDGHRGAMTPAVDLQYAHDTTFAACGFSHLGGAGVRMGLGCLGSRLVACRLSDIAGTGVLMGEPSLKVAQTVHTGGNRVDRCLIEKCGQVYYGAIGVWVGLSDRNSIAQSEIRHMPYTGVSVGWMWNPTPTPCMHNSVSKNHIHHVMQILSDGGGIYTLGRQPGTKLVGNWIHDVPVNAGRAESNGMFLDEGTTEILIEGNLIHDIARSPLRFHKAGKNLVKGNILVHPAKIPTVRYNRTPKENINLEGNETPKPTPGDKPVPGKKAKAIRDDAGRQIGVTRTR